MLLRQGIVLWELWGLHPLYPNMPPLLVATKVARHGFRPSPLPAILPEEPELSSLLLHDYSSLMTACWAQDPAKRPTFGDVMTALEAMLDTCTVFERSVIEKAATASDAERALVSRLLQDHYAKRSDAEAAAPPAGTATLVGVPATVIEESEGGEEKEHDGSKAPGLDWADEREDAISEWESRTVHLDKITGCGLPSDGALGAKSLVQAGHLRPRRGSSASAKFSVAGLVASGEDGGDGAGSWKSVARFDGGADPAAAATLRSVASRMRSHRGGYLDSTSAQQSSVAGAFLRSYLFGSNTSELCGEGNN